MTDPRSPAAHRGQTADRPSRIPLAGWRDILGRVYRSLAYDHVMVVAAGVAFFGLFAIFPAMGAVVAIAGLMIDPADVTSLVTGLFDVLPANAASVIEDQLAAVAGTSETASGFGALFGILLALYGAMRGVKTLMEGMNIAYEEEEKRSFIALNLAAVGLTLLLILGMVIGIGALVLLPVLSEVLALPPGLEGLLGLARWMILTLMAMFSLAVIYRYGPSRESAKWRWISPGAIVATVLWLVGTLAFSYYAGNFADYNATYGAIGGVIALLMWLWLSALIVLVGAELDAEMEHQTYVDSTTGPPRPMGRRGAFKADTTAPGVPPPPDAARYGAPEDRPPARARGWAATAALAIGAIGAAIGGRRN